LVLVGSMVALPTGFNLPCRQDPGLFFSESPRDVEQAKEMFRGCRARIACLAGALDRAEACGVWGGELLMRGAIVPVKRPRGRPRKTKGAAVLLQHVAEHPQQLPADRPQRQTPDGPGDNHDAIPPPRQRHEREGTVKNE
jgi:WhiB family transcriptional regulator, redox-sensing transcriptional regulator